MLFVLCVRTIVVLVSTHAKEPGFDFYFFDYRGNFPVRSPSPPKNAEHPHPIWQFKGVLFPLPPLLYVALRSQHQKHVRDDQASNESHLYCYYDGELFRIRCILANELFANHFSAHYFCISDNRRTTEFGRWLNGQDIKPLEDPKYLSKLLETKSMTQDRNLWKEIVNQVTIAIKYFTKHEMCTYVRV